PRPRERRQGDATRRRVFRRRDVHPRLRPSDAAAKEPHPRHPEPRRLRSHMRPWVACACAAAISLATSLVSAHSDSPNGVRTLDPPGAIKEAGTWSLGARAGDFIFVAGMRGIDPATNKLVKDRQARIRQAFLNIKTIAESEGASINDCVRLTV